MATPRAGRPPRCRPSFPPRHRAAAAVHRVLARPLRAGRPPRCRPSFPPPPRCRRRPPRSRVASPRRPPASLEKAADEAHEYPSLRPLDESQEEDPYPDEVISCSFPRPIVIASLFVYLLNADALVHGREMWCWDGGGRPQFRPDWVRADDACLQDRVPEMAGWDGVYSSRDVEPLCRARVVPLASILTPNQFEVELLTGLSSAA